jgi:hypothetical protein
MPNAYSRPFRLIGSAPAVIVIDLFLQVFRRERYTIIAVEIVVVGGYPFEAPPHPLLECFQLPAIFGTSMLAVFIV